jgi:hypothetical protein
LPFGLDRCQPIAFQVAPAGRRLGGGRYPGLRRAPRFLTRGYFCVALRAPGKPLEEVLLQRKPVMNCHRQSIFFDFFDFPFGDGKLTENHE